MIQGDIMKYKAFTENNYDFLSLFKKNFIEKLEGNVVFMTVSNSMTTEFLSSIRKM